MYDKPLCVDLDNTFIHIDLSIESFLRLLLKNPFLVFPCCLKLLKGKAQLKAFVSEKLDINPKNIPLNEDVITLIKKYKGNSQKVFLVTGSHKHYAEKIFEETGYFDEVYATENNQNLTKEVKAAKLCEKFGKGNFDYIGDSVDDIPVWKSSNKSYLVTKTKNNRLTKIVSFEQVFVSRKHSIFTYIFKQMRAHQWVKNLLIVVPVITSLSFDDMELCKISIMSAFLFSLVASSIYIINDIFDVENDRAHPEKCLRPIASGNLSLGLSISLVSVFLAFSFTGAFLIKPIMALLFFIYLLSNMFYSYIGKSIPILDLFFLCFFYMIRIFIGSIVTDISLSNWLLGFAFYFFLSLGLLKRYIETSKYLPYKEEFGRDYSSEDSIFLFAFGCISSIAATVILALFINEQLSITYYSKPNLLWIIFVIISYALMRIWHLAWKKQIKSDPVKFVTKDKATLGLIALTLGVIYLSA